MQDRSTTSSEITSLSSLIGDRAIVAVVEIDEPADAGRLAVVLAESGIDALEITLRQPRAQEALAVAADERALPVGAGTVVTPAIAEAAVASGAEFLVSPGLDEDVIALGRRLGVPTTPGVLTPSEVQAATRVGCSELKLFPAGLFGGQELLRALANVFTGVRFMPTGGVDHDGAVAYLRKREVFAVGGTWIAPRDLVASRAWSEIARRAARIRSDVDQLE